MNKIGFYPCAAILLLSAGCRLSPTERGSQASITSTPTATISSTRTQKAPKRSPTTTNEPSSTPPLLPTHQPSPTTTAIPTAKPSLTPSPDQIILIQFLTWGGDGGNPDYLSNDFTTPYLILYLNGRLIVRNPLTGDASFREITLSPEEMCELLRKIESTGFYNFETPNSVFFDEHDIYEFDETVQHSEGASFITIQVNGRTAHQIDIYSPYTGYLVEDINAAYQLLLNYHPQELVPYIPNQLVLRIAKGSGSEPTEQVPKTWPDTLVPLKNLLENSIAGEVIIDGDMIEPIFILVEDPTTGQIFIEDESEYFAVIRPLLPHESPGNYPIFPYQTTSYELPFACNR